MQAFSPNLLVTTLTIKKNVGRFFEGAPENLQKLSVYKKISLSVNIFYVVLH